MPGGVVVTLFSVVASVLVTLGVSVGWVVGFIVAGKESEYENEQSVSLSLGKITLWMKGNMIQLMAH